MSRPSTTLALVSLLMSLLPGRPSAAAPDSLDPLYRRIADDLKRGEPLVVTVHVALCDNNIIWCGRGGMGKGDHPRRNLYWGAAAGFKAYFDHARGYRRIMLDGGDGETILERAVYRKRIRRPSRRWRRLGVTRGFEVLVVGLAYRGSKINVASDTFIRQVAGRSAGQKLKLPDGRTLSIGAGGHLVGYAGHNHLMDVSSYTFPRLTRERPLGYFALSCRSGVYLARDLCGGKSRALLLTLSLMYPGAFTIDGLVRGVAAAAPQHQVFLGGVRKYSRFQKRPERIIRHAFIHDGQKRFKRRFTCKGR